MLILLSMVVAVVLMLLPMPGSTMWFRPAWVVLVLIYWTVVCPEQIGVLTAWVMGLLVDLLTGTIIGEHALAFTVVVYFVARMHMRLRMYHFAQQSISIFLFVLFYQFIIYLIQAVMGVPPRSYFYWSASLTSMLIWPFLFLLLRNGRIWLKKT